MSICIVPSLSTTPYIFFTVIWNKCSLFLFRRSQYLHFACFKFPVKADGELTLFLEREILSSKAFGSYFHWEARRNSTGIEMCILYPIQLEELKKSCCLLPCPETVFFSHLSPLPVRIKVCSIVKQCNEAKVFPVLRTATTERQQLVTL